MGSHDVLPTTSQMSAAGQLNSEMEATGTRIILAAEEAIDVVAGFESEVLARIVQGVNSAEGGCMGGARDPLKQRGKELGMSSK